MLNHKYSLFFDSYIFFNLVYFSKRVHLKIKMDYLYIQIYTEASLSYLSERLVEKKK